MTIISLIMRSECEITFGELPLFYFDFVIDSRYSLKILKNNKYHKYLYNSIHTNIFVLLII